MDDGMHVAHGKRVHLPKPGLSAVGRTRTIDDIFRRPKEKLMDRSVGAHRTRHPDPIAVYPEYLSGLTARQCRRFNDDACGIRGVGRSHEGFYEQLAAKGRVRDAPAFDSIAPDDEYVLDVTHDTHEDGMLGKLQYKLYRKQIKAHEIAGTDNAMV